MALHLIGNEEHGYMIGHIEGGFWRAGSASGPVTPELADGGELTVGQIIAPLWWQFEHYRVRVERINRVTVRLVCVDADGNVNGPVIKYSL